MQIRSEPDLSSALPRSFYERPVERVARGLLGSLLVRTDRGRVVAGGRIDVRQAPDLADLLAQTQTMLAQVRDGQPPPIPC